MLLSALFQLSYSLRTLFSITPLLRFHLFTSWPHLLFGYPQKPKDPLRTSAYFPTSISARKAERTTGPNYSWSSERRSRLRIQRQRKSALRLTYADRGLPLRRIRSTVWRLMKAGGHCTAPPTRLSSVLPTTTGGVNRRNRHIGTYYLLIYH